MHTTRSLSNSLPILSGLPQTTLFSIAFTTVYSEIKCKSKMRLDKPIERK